MSSNRRDAARAMGEASINGFVRRMANVPRTLLGGFSRAMNQGIDLIENGVRTNYHHHPPNYPPQHPSNFPFQDSPNFLPQQPPIVQEEWAFLANFEQQHGTVHPFFYACRFADTLKMAEDEHKFVFMYIHSPEHPFTSSFCRETLCSEVVVQFLDANFVCWGGLASRGEGQQMAASLRVCGFPFCAVVAPSGDNLAVLQQIEGPVSPAELVEILQRTMEEQGLAFGSGRNKQKEKKAADDRRLREEQDLAYLAALHIDQEKEVVQKNSSSDNKVQKQEKAEQSSMANNQPNKTKATSTSTAASQKAGTSGGKKTETTQILIRFPNGERREQSFLCKDKIEAIYSYIDSLGIDGVKDYRLISNFPRVVYGSCEKRMTLKDAGFHPKASLFLEIL